MFSFDWSAERRWSQRHALVVAVMFSVGLWTAWRLAAFDDLISEADPASEPITEFVPATQARRPVDFVMASANPPRLIVVNSASGTASVIDTGNETVIGEYAIGDRLSAIAYRRLA